MFSAEAPRPPPLRPSPGGALPSGHVTAIAGLSCAAVLVMTRRLRPLVLALGAVAVAAEAVATMILGMHLPFGVVAGVLMALGWTAAVVLVAPRRAGTSTGTP